MSLFCFTWNIGVFRCFARKMAISSVNVPVLLFMFWRETTTAMCNSLILRERSFVLSAKKHKENGNVRRRYARNARCLCQSLWIHRCQLLTCFGGELSERSVVEAVTDANVFESLHFFGKGALESNLSNVFYEYIFTFNTLLRI